MELEDIFRSRGYLPAQTAPNGPAISEAMLRRLRRQQLADLAHAFALPTHGDTKPELLQTCVAAIATGVYGCAPARPEYLRKALLDSDTAREHPERVDWERYRAPDIDMNNWHVLRKLARENGVNSFSLSKEALQNALREKGAI